MPTPKKIKKVRKVKTYLIVKTLEYVDTLFDDEMSALNYIQGKGPNYKVVPEYLTLYSVKKSNHAK